MRQFLDRGLSRRQMLAAGAGAGLLLPKTQIPALARQDTELTGTFRAMSWEGEAEMRKWLLHINSFFETNYPNLDMQIDYGISWENYWTKLQTTIAGNAQLDMCWMGGSRVQAYADLGLLMPLDDFIAQSPPDGWPDSFYQSQIDAFQFDGVQYAIPYDWATIGFYINLDVLERSGVDVPTAETTFEQILEAGLKIKESAPNPDEQWGFTLPTQSDETDWIVRCFGGSQVTTDPLTSHFDDPKTIAAYQYLYDAIWTHDVMPAPQAMEALGLADQVAFADGRVGIMYSLNDEAFVFGEIVGDQARWTMAPTPSGPGGRFQLVGGSAMSVPVTAAFPEVGYECIKFIATDPANLPVTAEMGSMFVSHKDYWENALPDPAQADPEVYKQVFYDLGARDGAVPLYFPGFQEWDATIYNKNMDRLWTGMTDDVAGVLQQVHEETQAFLDVIEA